MDATWCSLSLCSKSSRPVSSHRSSPRALCVWSRREVMARDSSSLLGFILLCLFISLVWVRLYYPLPDNLFVFVILFFLIFILVFLLLISLALSFGLLSSLLSRRTRTRTDLKLNSWLEMHSWELLFCRKEQRLLALISLMTLGLFNSVAVACRSLRDWDRPASLESVCFRCRHASALLVLHVSALLLYLLWCCLLFSFSFSFIQCTFLSPFLLVAMFDFQVFFEWW